MPDEKGDVTEGLLNASNNQDTVTSQDIPLEQLGRSDDGSVSPSAAVVEVSDTEREGC